MEELAYSAAIAPAIPFIASFIKSRSWPATVNMAIVAAIAFGVATVTLLISGQVDFDNGIQDPTVFFGAAAVAFTEATILYRLIIKGTVTGERFNEKLGNVIWGGVSPEGLPLGDLSYATFSGFGAVPEELAAAVEEGKETTPAEDAPAEPHVDPSGGGLSAEGRQPEPEEIEPGETPAEKPAEEVTGSDICADCGFGPRHPEHLRHTQ